MTTTSDESKTPELLTTRAAAEMLNVSKMTVYRLVRAGELPALRIGRSFRIYRHELETYIRNAQVG
ncbi:MAG: helix-turn-helix domain-containing protein [Pseudonocardia sp.]